MKVYEKEDNKETTQQTSQDYKKPDASKVNHSQLDMTIRFPRAASTKTLSRLMNGLIDLNGLINLAGYGIAGKQINIVIQNRGKGIVEFLEMSGLGAIRNLTRLGGVPISHARKLN
ncbi:5064_t:CDS:2, partial [Entrophospora sp. SA101]